MILQLQVLWKIIIIRSLLVQRQASPNIPITVLKFLLSRAWLAIIDYENVRYELYMKRSFSLCVPGLTGMKWLK